MAKNEFVVDLNGWRVREFRDYLTAVQSNDFDAMAGLIGKVVLEWPYEGDPNDADAVLDLTLAQLLNVAQEVGKAMQASFSQGE